MEIKQKQKIKGIKEIWLVLKFNKYKQTIKQCFGYSLRPNNPEDFLREECYQLSKALEVTIDPTAVDTWF